MDRQRNQFHRGYGMDRLPAEINKRVREKIQQSIIELVPEEHWDRIIEREIKDFENNRLKNLIREHLELAYKNVISTELHKPEWIEVFNTNGELMASEALKEILIQSAPQFFSVIIGSLVQGMTQNLRFTIENEISRFRDNTY